MCAGWDEGGAVGGHDADGDRVWRNDHHDGDGRQPAGRYGQGVEDGRRPRQNRHPRVSSHDEPSWSKYPWWTILE